MGCYGRYFPRKTGDFSLSLSSGEEQCFRAGTKSFVLGCRAMCWKNERKREVPVSSGGSSNHYDRAFKNALILQKAARLFLGWRTIIIGGAIWIAVEVACVLIASGFSAMVSLPSQRKIQRRLTSRLLERRLPPTISLPSRGESVQRRLAIATYHFSAAEKRRNMAKRNVSIGRKGTERGGAIRGFCLCYCCCAL